jgi:hypothetical protein
MLTNPTRTAVRVEGINAVFKMEGGEISGNGNSNAGSGNYCVNINAGGTFDMSGGSITGNNARYYADLFINDANCTFRLSGNAVIGSMILYANNNTTRSTITIAGNYSGMVTTLHLSGNSTNYTTIASFWTNAPVIVNGTASVISMFNNGGLGNFCRTNYYTNYGNSIRTTHELNASGVLVLK